MVFAKKEEKINSKPLSSNLSQVPYRWNLAIPDGACVIDGIFASDLQIVSTIFSLQIYLIKISVSAER